MKRINANLSLVGWFYPVEGVQNDVYASHQREISCSLVTADHCSLTASFDPYWRLTFIMSVVKTDVTPTLPNDFAFFAVCINILVQIRVEILRTLPLKASVCLPVSLRII